MGNTVLCQCLTNDSSYKLHLLAEYMTEIPISQITLKGNDPNNHTPKYFIDCKEGKGVSQSERE